MLVTSFMEGRKHGENGGKGEGMVTDIVRLFTAILATKVGVVGVAVRVAVLKPPESYAVLGST
jgi:hypothetical protein